MSTSSPLYGWQAEALGAWRSAGRRGIVEAVTGTGKTRVGVEATAECLLEGGRVLVIVPTKELQKQWAETLRRDLSTRPSIGLLGGGGRDSLDSHDLVVAIINSARTSELTVPPGALIVADECHRYAAEQSLQALDHHFDHRLGLTATLERPDGEHEKLVSYFGSVSYTIGYDQALSDEIVAHFSVVTIGVPLTGAAALTYMELTKQIGDRFFELVNIAGFPPRPFHVFIRRVKMAAEDPWHPHHLTARGFMKALLARRHLLATSEAKKAAAIELAPAVELSDRALIFTETIDAAADITRGLRARGLAAETMHSELTPAERSQVFRDFKRGALKAIVAPRVLDEGIDVPDADLAVVVASSKTRRQMVQRMGRVLRRKDDGRLARFAFLYLQGTSEDPSTGAHEAFMSEALHLADDAADFPIDELDAVIDFLAIEEPLRPAGAPRLEGEPRRRTVLEAPTADDLDALSVLALSTRV